MRAQTHIRHNNLISIGVLNEWRIGKASVASARNELRLPGTRTCDSHVLFSAHKKGRQIMNWDEEGAELNCVSCITNLKRTINRTTPSLVLFGSEQLLTIYVPLFILSLSCSFSSSTSSPIYDLCYSYSLRPITTKTNKYYIKKL